MNEDRMNKVFKHKSSGWRVVVEGYANGWGPDVSTNLIKFYDAEELSRPPGERCVLVSVLEHFDEMFVPYVPTAEDVRKDKRAEILAKLRRLESATDREGAHLQADNLLLELLNDPEIEEAYDNVAKWYS